MHKEAKNHLLGLGFEARETESYTAIIISRISAFPILIKNFVKVS